MYKHEVRIGRSTPNSSRSTSGPALTPGSAIGAAAFFAFCFYLIYKIVDLVIRPILVLLYRIFSSGVRYLYRNRRRIAQAIVRSTTNGYSSVRKFIETRRAHMTPARLQADAIPKPHDSGTIV
jgi:hypothetical protein